MFLEFINNYRRFVSNLSRVKAPVIKLVLVSHFTWSKDVDNAVSVVKKLMCRNTVLAYPARHAKLVIDTDASDDGLCSLIAQIDSNKI